MAIDYGQHAVEPAFTQHAADVALATEDHELKVAASRPRVDLHEDPQAGRVHELQAAQVEHEPPDNVAVAHDRLELIAKSLLAIQIELPAEAQDDGVEIPLRAHGAVPGKLDHGLVEHGNLRSGRFRFQ